MVKIVNRQFVLLIRVIRLALQKVQDISLIMNFTFFTIKIIVKYEFVLYMRVIINMWIKKIRRSKQKNIIWFNGKVNFTVVWRLCSLFASVLGMFSHFSTFSGTINPETVCVPVPRVVSLISGMWWIRIPLSVKLLALAA